MMRVALVQIASEKADIQANISKHLAAIDVAAAGDSSMVIFPELSITGYEPTLAASLRMEVDDKRLEVFQNASDRLNIFIAAGLPISESDGISIGMVVYRPFNLPLVYRKQFLHPDEEAFFVPGVGGCTVDIGSHKVAFAICYEISIDSHIEHAANSGATVYLASAVKYAAAMSASRQLLADKARALAITTMICNAVGWADGQEAAGQSAAWDTKGRLIDSLEAHKEGVLLVDVP